MKPETMRLVDDRFGRPVCAALTLHRRLTERRPVEPAAPERILVVKLVEQGATVVAYSALVRACEMVGPENVFVMVFAENRFIIDQLGLIPAENLIAIDTSGLRRFVTDTVAAVRRVRSLGIDSAVDFEFFARSSAILTYLSGARRRVGFHAHANEASSRGDLMTHRLVYNPRLHASEVFLLLVEALSLSPSQLPVLDVPSVKAEAPPETAVTLAERAGIRRLLSDLLPAGEPLRLVLLNANASDLVALRRWPSERYVELARRLLDRHPDVAVAFTGAGDEAEHADALAASVGSDRCISLGGRTTMRDLLVLYSESEVLVTNDSGPAHYAALAPIDVVTLFGPETPHMFRSLSPRNHVVWASLPCSPCVNAFNDRTSPCTDNVCMQRIGVDEVDGLVDGILERTR